MASFHAHRYQVGPSHILTIFSKAQKFNNVILHPLIAICYHSLQVGIGFLFHIEELSSHQRSKENFLLGPDLYLG